MAEEQEAIRNRKPYAEQQIQQLIDKAQFSTDVCLVAKAIALTDSESQALFYDRLTDPFNKFIGIHCIQNGNEVGVVFRFECIEICIVTPTFLSVVNLRRRRVTEIVDAFTGAEWPESVVVQCPVPAPVAGHGSCGCGQGVESPRSTHCSSQQIDGEFSHYGVLAVQPDGSSCETAGSSAYATRTIELGKQYFKDGCGSQGCRNCHADFYAELSHPRIGEAIGAANDCLRVAAVAAAVTAILGNIAGAVAVFDTALKTCLVAKGVDFAFEISVAVRRRDRSCGGCSWSNCVN